MDMLGNEQQKFDKAKSIKVIKIISIILVIMFVLILATLFGIYYMQSKEFKVIINDSKISQIPEDTFIVQDDNVYVSIKDVAEYLGDYKYNNGGYKQYSEDKTSCYLINDYEVVTYSLNSTNIYKVVLAETSTDVKTDTNKYSSGSNDSSIYYEYYTIDEPVKMINNKLYTTLSGIEKGCNVLANYDKQKNTLSIYTISKLATYYTNLNQEAAVEGEKALFSNKKALLYNLVVVKNSKNLYGVYNTNNEEIIGKKYTSIKFIESSQEFIVETEEGKQGIIFKDGTTKIKPEYDEIKQIDANTDLYLVSNNKKYGIVNKNGKIVIYLEYDAIGVDPTKFESDNISNKYILYDNCIPVEKGEKWGLMDKNGNTIVDTQYDSLGCIIGTSSYKTANNLLMIPEYEAIVIQKDKLYGIINSKGEELIPPAANDVYSITTNGKNDYWLTYNNTKINVLDYLQNTLKISPVDKSSTSSSNANTTTSNNQVNETTQQSTTQSDTIITTNSVDKQTN